MQHQQQRPGGGGGPQSLGGYGGGVAAVSDEDQKLGDLGIAEAASPISSRPPAPAAIRNANFEEMIQATAEAGGSSSNRWPRQETLALLQIRSEMDTAFRDATLKGPLWDQVSRKLGELGYKRSAKKCKEKFENVHKYYKRTKEGRSGRQDGKSYKFFSQLEALHHNTAAALLTNPTPSIAATATAVSLPIPAAVSQPPPPDSAAAALFGISFSSDSSSSDSEDDDHDDEEMEEMEANQRKRKRSEGGGGESDERMMDFFEGLLKQVMQKQEAMQQRFLEAIEKREQDRMIREEAWKRQDMARIAKEHEIAAQERAVSASRDAAIVDFLEKITGQTIHLPAPAPAPPRPEPQPPILPQTAPEMAAPLQTAGTDAEKINVGGSTSESSSSRWPKAEVLALIKIRSSMEAKYQEAGPKGPLWEEISAGMQRIGYSRSAKRCKEKWENINKYFKKVKESNKKRPQDAKTCPYFDELDELYRKKILSGSTANVGGASSENVSELQRGAFPSNPFGDTNIGGEQQPEDMLDKGHQDTTGNYCNSSLRFSNSDHDLDEDSYEEVDENEEEYDDKDMKMVYKLQFQTQNVGSSNPTARASAASSFVAMVQ